MCYLAKFFVSCNEKLENFASLQKGDIIMPESLSDPSSPRSKINYASLFICVSGIAVWHMYYHSTATVRADNVQPLLPLHDCYYFYLFCKRKVYVTKWFQHLSPHIIYTMTHSHRYVFSIYTWHVIYRYATFN